MVVEGMFVASVTMPGCLEVHRLLPWRLKACEIVISESKSKAQLQLCSHVLCAACLGAALPQQHSCMSQS